MLRAAIRDDELLHLAVAADTAEAVVLGHTRWASVGIISEAERAPAQPRRVESRGRGRAATSIGALNGDVDNYADLEGLEALDAAAEITTDAKVIPTLVVAPPRGRARPDEAFRATVAALEGSVAIGAAMADAPGRLLLALRGSGQALYVGLAEDAFVVASEPYGLVEETARYLRIDGETPADPERAAATRGQIVVLDAAHAGDARGHPPARVRRHARCRCGRRPPARRDHDPRHRPRRLPALPAEGDLGGAGLVPQDAAGQDRRARRAAARAPRPPTRCPTPYGRGSPTARSGGWS